MSSACATNWCSCAVSAITRSNSMRCISRSASRVFASVSDACSARSRSFLVVCRAFSRSAKAASVARQASCSAFRSARRSPISTSSFVRAADACSSAAIRLVSPSSHLLRARSRSSLITATALSTSAEVASAADLASCSALKAVCRSANSSCNFASDADDRSSAAIRCVSLSSQLFRAASRPSLVACRAFSRSAKAASVASFASCSAFRSACRPATSSSTCISDEEVRFSIDIRFVSLSSRPLRANTSSCLVARNFSSATAKLASAPSLAPCSAANSTRTSANSSCVFMSDIEVAPSC